MCNIFHHVDFIYNLSSASREEAKLSQTFYQIAEDVYEQRLELRKTEAIQNQNKSMSIFI